MFRKRVRDDAADVLGEHLSGAAPRRPRGTRAVWLAGLGLALVLAGAGQARADDEPMDPSEILEPEAPTRDTMPGDETRGGEPIGHRQVPRNPPPAPPQPEPEPEPEPAESEPAPAAPPAVPAPAPVTAQPAEAPADPDPSPEAAPVSGADDDAATPASPDRATPPANLTQTFDDDGDDEAAPTTTESAKPTADTDAEHADADHGHGGDGHGRTSRISDTAVPDIEMHPRMQRPKPLLELGAPFLGTGKIEQGIELPTGAVWQPQFVVFGTYRTAVQVFDNGIDTQAEWANRLDLFGNLQLSGTERLLVGIRPLDDDNVFTGYYFKPDDADLDGFENGTSLELSTLFFEGDVGEIFPNADPTDRGSLDLGFSIGRQPLFYQEGLLINDDIDAVGIIRNTLLPVGGSDLQATFVYGWNEIHRGNNQEANDTNLFGLFTQADLPLRTVNVDLVYVHDDEADNSGFFWGASSVQRIGHYNTAFRLVGSHATENETAAVQDGVVAFGEVSWTPAWGHDLVYVNGFVGFDNFRSAARGPATGGPLGRTGLLFAAVGLGRYGAALDNNADRSVGAAMGYQMFLDEQHRQQIVLEGGVRVGTDDSQDSAIAGGARYQRAFGQNYILQLDAFVGARESRDMLVGSRVEFRIEF